LARKNELIPLFARHGIGLRIDILQDRSRHFDSHLVVPPEISKLAKLRNQLTNSLSDTLDDLEAWLEVTQQRLPATRSAEEVIELPRLEEEPASSLVSKPVLPRAAAASAVAYLASSRH
jgi:hypothetical protein